MRLLWLFARWCCVLRSGVAREKRHTKIAPKLKKEFFSCWFIIWDYSKIGGENTIFFSIFIAKPEKNQKKRLLFWLDCLFYLLYSARRTFLEYVGRCPVYIKYDRGHMPLFHFVVFFLKRTFDIDVNIDWWRRLARFFFFLSPKIAPFVYMHTAFNPSLNKLSTVRIAVTSNMNPNTVIRQI